MKQAKHMLRILAVAVLLVSVIIPPVTAAAVNAAPARLTVLVNGTERKFESYLIGGNSYFRLRDVAYSLSGTARQFEVSFDGINNQINLISGAVYTPIGGEMEIFGSGTSVNAAQTTLNVYLDGTKLNLTTFIIGAHTYIKLRELAAAVNFGVTYQAAAGAIAIDTSVGYTPDAAPASSTSTDAPNDLRVTMIGDSIGVGIEPYLKKLLPKLDNHSKVSRQFSEAKSYAQQLLNAGTLAPTVIIELGTNGTIKESDMRSLIELLGNSRKIIFVNCQVPRSWEASNNSTIAKVAPDYQNTTVVDWNGASEGQGGYLSKDGFHPSSTGAKVLSQLIADAVQKMQ